MSVSSFSANKLAALISKFSADTIGLDALRYDIAPALGEIIPQADNPAQKVLAYVLRKKCLGICERFDGEPMTEKESQAIVSHLKGTIQEALQFLASGGNDADESIRLANTVITFEVQ